MDYISAIALSITVITAVWGHAIWLSGRFSSVQKDFNEKIEKILETITDKLEYHERHDDRRFSEISNNLWEVRLQNALGYKAKSGKKSEEISS